MKVIISILIILFSLFPTPANADGAYDLAQKIDAPSYSYEGHIITVTDKSLFHYGGLSFRDINEASNAGYIQSSWMGNYELVNIAIQNPVDGTSHNNISKMNIRYDKPCNDVISLKDKWLKGPLAETSERIDHNIEIRSCPAIESAVFSGEQRAYQRQQLDIKIAQHPTYPIDLNSVQLVIRDSRGRIQNLNRGLIKSFSADGQFVICSIEFLTKNSTGEYFTYNVTATDSRGQSMNITNRFWVKADSAPQASIDMKTKFYRAEGGGPAIIKASYNGSFIDDAVEISWDLPEGSYNDESGGQNSVISFPVSNPGNYSLTITCNDIWADTLEEFVYESERKESSFTVSFQVANIAPVLGESNKEVSLELLLKNYHGGSDEELYRTLLESNIKSEIFHADADENEIENSFNLLGKFESTQPSDCDTNSSFGDSFCCDDHYVYKLVPQIDAGKNFSAPFTIYKYSLDELTNPAATFYISNELFPGAALSDPFSMGYDLQEKNLYITVDGITAVIDKTSGYIYPTVNFSFGKTNFISNGLVYTLTENGLYSVDLNNGSVSLELDCTCILAEYQSARIFKGDVYFTGKEGSSIYLYKFNIKNRNITKTLLGESAAENKDFLLAITPSRKIIINSKNGKNALVRVWDENGSSRASDLEFSLCALWGGIYAGKSGVYPVFDYKGEVNYVFTTSDTSAGGKCTAYVYSLYGYGMKSVKALSNTYFIRPLAATEMADGNIVILTGANYLANSTTTYCNRFQAKLANSTSSIVYSYNNRFEYFFRYNDTYVLSYGYKEKSYTHVYRFSEGCENKLQRLAGELMPYAATYKMATANPNTDEIIKYCGMNSGSDGGSFSSRHYKIGETVRLEDFGISAELFTDYENDKPFVLGNSLDLPRSFSQPGVYSFTFWATDTTANSAFNQSSKRYRVMFYVDGELPTEEIEPEDTSAAARNFVLHRKY